MNKLVAQLQGVVGVDAVLSDTNSIAFYTNDIYSKGSDCIASKAWPFSLAGVVSHIPVVIYRIVNDR